MARMTATSRESNNVRNSEHPRLMQYLRDVHIASYVHSVVLHVGLSAGSRSAILKCASDGFSCRVICSEPLPGTFLPKRKVCSNFPSQRYFVQILRKEIQEIMYGQRTRPPHHTTFSSVQHPASGNRHLISQRPKQKISGSHID